MRILFTIPHFFDPQGGGHYGSRRPDAGPRLRALTACVAALHRLFGQPQYMIDHARRVAVPANQSPVGQIDVVVCTIGGRHLLADLPVPAASFAHHATQAEPMLLGFECHHVLQSRLGSYDYYCYLEDDLILHDPWFFIKLAWSTAQMGDDSLLQPNRFETAPHGPARKAYIDGNLALRVTAPFQDVREQPRIEGRALGHTVRFRRALNPHSGCFFLNARQMEQWSRQPYFGERDTRFVGPLESAASLGIMRAFRVYKPVAPNAHFLEIEHFGTAYLRQIGHAVRLPPVPAHEVQEGSLVAQLGSQNGRHDNVSMPRRLPAGPDTSEAFLAQETANAPPSHSGPAPPDRECPTAFAAQEGVTYQSDVHVAGPADALHVLFVHPNYPAQFGHVADYLAKNKGFRCTFVSQRPPGRAGGVERIQYPTQGGASRHNHYCSCGFENVTWHSHAVYEALKARPDIRPDLVVGHSGFASTLFLRELYDCPVINYFEYFYRTTGSDLDFRPDFPSTEQNRLRARARNAALLLDLENCDAGYSPTHWQRDRLPGTFHDKVRVIFDGIDTDLWRPLPDTPRRVANRTIPDDVRIVTYVSRGMESMRGFNIFMKMAKLICDRRKDVVFVVAGQDRVCYGGDTRFNEGKSFREWVLAQDNYDRSRFLFVGLLPPPTLAQLFAISDLHVYLTVPFVLSWSLMNALACGATVLASRTGSVCEVIEHGQNGLVADFFDIEGLANTASQVLDAPGDNKHLSRAGVETVRSRYSLEVCLPQMLDLYHTVLASCRSGGQPANGQRYLEVISHSTSVKSVSPSHQARASGTHGFSDRIRQTPGQ